VIKAVACDIDGTLTDERRRLELEAVRLLRELEALGVPVVLATGNTLCHTLAASTYIGTTGPVIAENGGVVKERGSEPVYLSEACGEELERAYEHLSALLPVRRVEMSELRKTEICIRRDFNIEVIREALQGFDVKAVDTRFAIHIMGRGVSKGAALSYVAGRMGLDENEFAALGDSENDLDMLEKAGLAVGVHDTALKAVAKYWVPEGYGRGGVKGLRYILRAVEKGL